MLLNNYWYNCCFSSWLTPLLISLEQLHGNYWPDESFSPGVIYLHDFIHCSSVIAYGKKYARWKHPHCKHMLICTKSCFPVFPLSPTPGLILKDNLCLASSPTLQSLLLTELFTHGKHLEILLVCQNAFPSQRAVLICQQQTCGPFFWGVTQFATRCYHCSCHIFIVWF